ncbi:hypothetical protein M1D72_05830 [Vibrio sp. AK197]
MIQNLEKLWGLTGTTRDLYDGSESLYFDLIGLNLLKNPECWGYWCTPTNTVSFASTGGDGVHFGFLCESNEPTENSPIVMTIPCADVPNIIVGENLRDFLSLGCRCGYFGLEQIEYQPKIHIPLLDAQLYPDDMTSIEIGMLKLIESEFQLTPWLNHAGKLAELKLKYFGLLNYSDEYYEITT